MIHIKIHQQFQPDIDRKHIRKIANHILSQEKNTSELTILLTNNAYIQEVNRTYRSIDTPTDVLSFPLNEIDPTTGKMYLGDIIISVEKAKSQAIDNQHVLSNEVSLLVVHGILHLLGYDHHTEEEKQTMWTKQISYLNDLGIFIKRMSES